MCCCIQFMLAVKWKDIRLTSKPLSFPSFPLSQQKSKGADSNKSATTVQMMSDSSFTSEEGSLLVCNIIIMTTDRITQIHRF